MNWWYLPWLVESIEDARLPMKGVGPFSITTTRPLEVQRLTNIRLWPSSTRVVGPPGAWPFLAGEKNAVGSFVTTLKTLSTKFGDGLQAPTNRLWATKGCKGKGKHGGIWNKK